MKKIFVILLAIIGGIIGFIVGITITLSFNINSLTTLYGLGAVLALIGGVMLSSMAPSISTQEANIQKALAILCTLIAIILLLLFIVTISMLNSYFQV